MSSRYLLVYGTLRSGYDNRYARLLARSAKNLGGARVQARLYNLGRYPGIRLQRNSDEWVTGEMFRLRDLSILRVLDEYEGPEFNRVLTTALLETREQEAAERKLCWVYEYVAKCPRGSQTRLSC